MKTQINPDTMTVLTLQDQITQARAWLSAAEKTLGTLLAKRAPELDAPPPAPTVVVPAPVAPSVPSGKRRSKAEILAEALALNIPEHIITGENFLGPKGRKPSNLKLDASERLISEVKVQSQAGTLAGFWTNFQSPPA